MDTILKHTLHGFTEKFPADQQFVVNYNQQKQTLKGKSVRKGRKSNLETQKDHKHNQKSEAVGNNPDQNPPKRRSLQSIISHFS